jgi:hypothetical protein
MEKIKASSAFKNWKEWEQFLNIVEKANNRELTRMSVVINHEKRLSKQAVKEGFEAKGKLKKFMKEGI